MPSLKSLRRRIGSVKNTRQITRAMKLVAAAKLRRAQAHIVKMRPYAYRMGDMIAEVARGQDADSHPLLAVRDPKRTLLLVLTSDKGLAGAFNSNVCKSSFNWVKDNQDNRDHIELHVVGKKGRDFFKSRPVTVGKLHTDVLPDPSWAAARTIGKELTAAYIDGQFDEVYVVYNEFKSAIQQDVRVERLLPVQPESLDVDDDVIAPPSSDTLFEPSRSEVLDNLLPRHVNVQILRALYESVASEMGARMTAMENATNNAGDLIRKLTLQYNRARQAAITTELTEIVAGAESLNG
ncbi:MAG TPA: ATP synthase F1 subunit gamma [Myxococcales bacterium]|nr:ATP synthase F1 subunit gamma [Myxococcales bacterium]HAN32772.1 ATP synthase F1 subunit gamma [Myxococcales bacterium]